MHWGVEGQFAEEVPFHREKASPALLASIGEYTIFILTKSCLLFSVVDYVVQCCMVWFSKCNIGAFYYWYLCRRAHNAVFQMFCMLMFICAYLRAACVFTHCCGPHAVILTLLLCSVKSDRFTRFLSKKMQLISFVHHEVPWLCSHMAPAHTKYILRIFIKCCVFPWNCIHSWCSRSKMSGQ